MADNMNEVPPDEKLWQRSTDELVKQYQTNEEDGISEQEAAKRLARDGYNELTAKKKSKLLQFLLQFNNSIIYILIAAAVITLFMHHYSDSAVIGIVIIANAFIGFFQEMQADNALSKIKELLVSQNYVIRDGHKIEVPARELVVGDLVNLEAGDAVPADLRLISADNMRAQESTLTGESNSVEKTEDPINKDSVPLAERSNMAFASTAVTQGSGVGIVIATGKDTQIGQIQQSVAEVKTQVTPLMRNLNKLGINLSLFIVAIAILLFVLGLYTKIYSLPTLTIAIITMVVGSIPEGLPASTSVVLARGVQVMTKKGAIVKTLPAVETLGAVDIVDTDKTGTLTKNEMTVTDVITDQHHYQVTGVGFIAGDKGVDGDVLLDGQKYDWKQDQQFRDLVDIAGTTTDAELVQTDGEWQLNGEPTDGALTTLFHKLIGREPEVDEVDTLPFDSAYRYSARLIKENDHHELMVKGAPGTIFDMVKQSDPNFDDQTWYERVAKLTEQGLRVVALGYKNVSTDVDEIDQDKIADGIQLSGVVGIIDPPREEVIPSIQSLRRAGVKVNMITGDHPDTASAIARKLDLDESIHAITGPEIDEMSDEDLIKNIGRYNVFARTTPANKLRIVKAQQANSKIVAMTGDGVNDAAALKQANIGIAMGIKGTAVAKEAADMVLVNDSFTTIVDAVAEGRHVFDNIQKTIRFLLPTSFAEGLVVLISMIMGQELPLFPTQLLWINTVSALTIQFAFIFEPAEESIMIRGPRNVAKGILGKMDVFEITYVSILISALGIFTFDRFVDSGVLTAVLGSTMAVNIIIFGKIFYLFNIRNSYPIISKHFFENKMAFIIIGILLALQAAMFYIPFMQDVFHTGSIDFFYGWVVPTIAGFIVLVVTEIIKLGRIEYRKRKGQATKIK
ncbi:HAD-IC family P-type ATPase [Lentilactobacillus buchneri]|uniref:Cation-transporting P-type ATPase N-terminal domain-containing protein n=1 Tax=Lentilactobacillus buchneri DSM 20057 TaxID=1423728 RepID=A0A4V3A453_LENBU|nr:HAD-IC family P-type ATPase [Lentilactobacillus buchneri]AEB74224.1 ATPase, P-type (transporting), HAD superfamily, subfamily IC [Lentilactobacillus buchneri NRRL B-30929]KRK67734.1 P-type (transporting) HAD superfamily ATPase [Lentilactobacillus buchneri DSM 20057]MCT2881694.1 HAD family hydrolase [Lentilactobacillus buchneri]MCT3554417.1 HAD family hydrolase [Lentilactobacillus buchneri]MCT3558060.1 HAD family hydrolase [Lentilactobacillus buchneri]